MCFFTRVTRNPQSISPTLLLYYFRHSSAWVWCLQPHCDARGELGMWQKWSRNSGRGSCWTCPRGDADPSPSLGNRATSSTLDRQEEISLAVHGLFRVAQPWMSWDLVMRAMARRRWHSCGRASEKFSLFMFSPKLASTCHQTKKLKHLLLSLETKNRWVSHIPEFLPIWKRYWQAPFKGVKYTE